MGQFLGLLCSSWHLYIPLRARARCYRAAEYLPYDVNGVGG